MFMSRRSYLLLLLLLPCSFSEAIKVISTGPEESPPEKSGQAIILNSALQELSEWTICARFKTFHFSGHEDSSPFQTVIASGGLWVLSSFTALPCDGDHQGVLTRLLTDIY